MTSLLNVIEDYLLYRQWKYCRIDGSTKIDERQRQMDVFNVEKTAGAGGTRNDGDDRHFVFLLSRYPCRRSWYQSCHGRYLHLHYF
jgi:ATP-dependent DNA helicase